MIAILNCFVGATSQSKPATKASDDDGGRSKSIREKAIRFRILIMGRANAGKTTILQKVCNTAEQPEIFDNKGNKVRNPSAKDQNGANDTDELLMIRSTHQWSRPLRGYDIIFDRL